MEAPDQSYLRQASTVWLKRVIEWTEEWKRQGLEQGLEKGRQEGRQEGEAALLLRQIELRFGPLSEFERGRIQSADADTLLRWGERVLTATSLSEMFND